VLLDREMAGWRKAALPDRLHLDQSDRSLMVSSLVVSVVIESA
jgi:hypothetical protein